MIKAVKINVFLIIFSKVEKPYIYFVFTRGSQGYRF